MGRRDDADARDAAGARPRGRLGELLDEPRVRDRQGREAETKWLLHGRSRPGRRFRVARVVRVGRLAPIRNNAYGKQATISDHHFRKHAAAQGSTPVALITAPGTRTFGSPAALQMWSQGRRLR